MTSCISFRPLFVLQCILAISGHVLCSQGNTGKQDEDNLFTPEFEIGKNQINLVDKPDDDESARLKRRVAPESFQLRHLFSQWPSLLSPAEQHLPFHSQGLTGQNMEFNSNGNDPSDLENNCTNCLGLGTDQDDNDVFNADPLDYENEDEEGNDDDQLRDDQQLEKRARDDSRLRILKRQDSRLRILKRQDSRLRILKRQDSRLRILKRQMDDSRLRILKRQMDDSRLRILKKRGRDDSRLRILRKRGNEDSRLRILKRQDSRLRILKRDGDMATGPTEYTEGLVFGEAHGKRSLVPSGNLNVPELVRVVDLFSGQPMRSPQHHRKPLTKEVANPSSNFLDSYPNFILKKSSLEGALRILKRSSAMDEMLRFIRQSNAENGQSNWRYYTKKEASPHMGGILRILK